MSSLPKTRRRIRRLSFDGLERRNLLTAGNLGHPGDGYLDITFLPDGYSDLHDYHSDVNRLEATLLSLEPFKSRADQIRFHDIDNPGSVLGAGGAVNESAVDSLIGSSGPTTDFAFVVHDGRTTPITPTGTDDVMVDDVEANATPADSIMAVAREAARAIGRLDPTAKGPLNGSDWKDMVAPDEYFAPGTSAGNWDRPWKQTSYRSILTTPGNTSFDFVSQAALRSGIDYWAAPSSDTEAPAVAFDALTNGSDVAGVVPVRIAVNDDRGVTAAQLWVDGRLVRTSVDAPFTLYWKTGGQALGDHTLVVKAFDAAGNIGETSPIHVDLTRAEDLTIAYPVNATSYSVATPPKIQVVYWPGEVDGAFATLDGIPLGSLPDNVPVVPNLTAAGAPTNAGVHTIRVYTTNAQVGTGPNQVLDSASSSIVKLDGERFDFASGHQVQRVVGTTKFTISTTPSKTVSFFLDGNLVGTGKGKNVTLTLNSRLFSNGVHVLVAKSGSSVAERTLTIDNPLDLRLPVVTIATPKKLSASGNNGLLVSGKATDNVGLSRVELLIDGQIVSKSNAIGVSYPFTFQVNTAGWSKGKHQIRVRATDLAGNVGWSQKVNTTFA